jgi:hypothetical protein
METLWLIVVIGGPLLLAGVIIWSMRHNRLTARQQAERDAGTRRLREEGEAEERRRDGAI